MLLMAFLLLPLLLFYGYLRIWVMRPAFFLKALYETENEYATRLDIGRTDAERVLEKMFSYVMGKEDSPAVAVTISGKQVSFYNERELAHLKDVRKIFVVAKFVAGGIFAWELLAVILTKKRLDGKVKFRVFALAEFVMALLVGMLIWMANRDMLLFVSKFHHLFFSNNSWVLNDATDRLVLLFPKVIYKETLVGYLVVLAIFLIVTNVILLRGQRKEKKVAA